MSTDSPVLSVAARTDVGVRRTVNEDAVLASDPFYLVADGMGGHDAGDRASAAAIETFAAHAGSELTHSGVEAVIEASRSAVAAVAMQTVRGAGCTLSGVIRITHEGQPYWYVLNIGDSRVYLHRGSELTQLTADHSLHAQLLAEGNPSAATAPRNVITRALGSPDSRHDAWMLPVQTGARLLVCSDGLTNEIDEEELNAVLTVGGQAETVVDELVRRARDAGGRDNISVIVIDTLAGGAEVAEERDAEPLDSSLVDTLDTENDDTVELTKRARP